MHHLREKHLSHHGRHDVAVFQVEVIIRPIEVGRHHRNIVRAVLQVVAFTHFESRDFRDGILLVGIFKWRCEQCILFHGLRRILGIDASRTEEEQLFYPMSIRFADDVALYLHVLHDKIRPIERIGHNAPYESSRQHHGLGLFLIEEPPHLVLFRQVQLSVCSSDEVMVSSLLQVFPNGRPHESAMSGHIYFRIFSESHSAI